MSHDQETLFLSLEEVVAAGGADMDAAIADVEQGFELFAAGEITQPPKVALTNDGSVRDGFNLLPGFVPVDGREVFGCKLLGANPANAAKGLPRAVGLLALFDGDTKVPLAVMDAQVISATRTGAVSGLAARHLAPEDTSSIGLLGAGVNMKTQLLGISRVLPELSRASIYALNGSQIRFAADMSERTGLAIVPALDPREAVEDQGFTVLCTTKPAKPLIERDWLPEEGVTLFNISGVATPPEALPGMDRIVTDSLENSRHRGTQTLPAALDAGLIEAADVEELGLLIAAEDGRRSDEENIFFCPVGLAFEDILVAWRVYQTAVRQRIGQRVTLWADSEWI